MACNGNQPVLRSELLLVNGELQQWPNETWRVKPWQRLKKRRMISMKGLKATKGVIIESRYTPKKLTWKPGNDKLPPNGIFQIYIFFQFFFPIVFRECITLDFLHRIVAYSCQVVLSYSDFWKFFGTVYYWKRCFFVLLAAMCWVLRSLPQWSTS